MKEISDQELIEELKKRIESNNRLLQEQAVLMGDLEKVNKKLVESEMVKSQFLSNIRNEINNPLTSILGLSKNIILKAADKSKVESHGKLIYKEAFILDFQLRNIFCAAEIEAGNVIPESHDFLVSELIDQTLLEFNHLIRRKNLEVDFKNEIVGIDIFRSDVSKLQLIISNLIANAIEFNSESGKIFITTSVHNGDLKIEVKDNGIGIHQKDHGDIFDRFKQLDTGIAKTHYGHGLGLSISKNLLDIIGGEITVESQLKEGSNFSICIHEMDSKEKFNQDMAEDETFFDQGGDILF